MKTIQGLNCSARFLNVDPVISGSNGVPPTPNPLFIIFSGGSRIFQMGGHCFVANGGAHILFSGKKCMKLKEIGLKWGGARLLAPCYSKITIFL